MAKFTDPYAEREKQRYANPIPSREYILQTLQTRGKPANLKKLAELLELPDPEQQEVLSRRLRAMERDGQLVTTRRGEYGLVSKMNLIAGRVVGHRDGFGFVIPDDGSEDLFLPSRYMRAVFDGDRVLVRVSHIDRRGRREGALVQVLECNTHQLVGRLQEIDGMLFVIPDHKRVTQEILIPPHEAGTAEPGQIVSAAITTQPGTHRQPIGKIIEILGDPQAPGLETEIAIRSHSLPYEWSPEILADAQQFTELTPGASYSDREDLRHLPFVTIDGADAKDFDDAIFCEEKTTRSGGWRLIVAIADVSHYVKPLSLLDQEALKRGNSVYFPDLVLPMLPEALSNGLCSLNPHVDRLCLACDMQISATGKISRYRFYPAVIHSHARLTYTQVASALAEAGHERAKLGNLFPYLEGFQRLYQQLAHNRRQRGALDFDTVETRVLFDQQRKIRAIVPAVRNVAHKMIEEAMLAANVCAARLLLKQNVPTLFRVHEGPTPEKLTDLRDFLKEFSLGLRGAKKPQPHDYAQLLTEIADRPDARLIQTVLLRSLRQAIYTPHNNGHFGLAYPAYTHFTSPIRRYPDLLIHRHIHAVLKNEIATVQEEPARLQTIGEHCSFTERRADEATRDALDALKCAFIAHRVGETFGGLITAVTGFGLFVELADLYVEGLVHISTLPSDYYRFDPVKHRLVGERNHMHFRLGDSVQVTVARVNQEEKKIELILTDSNKHGKTQRRRRRR